MNRSQASDRKAAGSFTILTAASRGLGLVRTWLMATCLGGTRGADAFWAAFRLVNFFRLFLGEGALGHAMMPVLKDLEERDPAAARRFAAACTRLSLVGCVLLLIPLLLFLEPILTLYVPDFSASGRGLTAALFTRMSPYLVFIGVASVLMIPLQALRAFAPTAAHPILFNLSILVCGGLAFLFPSPALAFAFGVVLGGLLQMLYLARWAMRMEVPLLSSTSLGLADPALREVAWLTAPTLLGVGLMRLSSVVDVRFAAGLAPGAVSCLTYAFQIYAAVLGITSVGVATVYFTALSRSRAEGDEEGFRHALGDGGGLIFTITMPALVLGTAFPGTLTAIFVGGRFGAEEQLLTAAALRFYMAGLVFGGLFQLFSRALYAGKQQLRVVLSGTVAACLHITLAWHWVVPFGVAGLSGASTTALGLNAAVLAWMLRADVPFRSYLASLARTLAAAAIAAASCLVMPANWVGSPLVLPPVFGLVYLLVLMITGSREYGLLRDMLRRRRRRAGEDDGPGHGDE